MTISHPLVASIGVVVVLLGRGRAAERVPRVRIEDLRNVAAFEMSARPNLLLLHGRSLVVGSFRDATLCVFDRKSARRTHRFVLVKSGNDVEIVEDDGGRNFDRSSLAPLKSVVVARGKLFLLTAFAKSILVLDATTCELRAMLPSGSSGRLAVSPDQRFVYHASNVEPRFNVIDAETLKFRSVAYPKGGRGIGALAVSADGRRLYLGIQRGGRPRRGPPLGGGNAFLAVYDLVKERYAGTVYLARIANGRSDDSLPSTLLIHPEGLLYIGMRQSAHAYRVVDPGRLAIDHNVDLPVPLDRSYPFRWPNVAGGGFEGSTLISLHRGGEVHLWNTKRKRLLGILELGAASGLWPSAAVVDDGMLYVAHPQYKCVYRVSLDEIRRRSNRK